MLDFQRQTHQFLRECRSHTGEKIQHSRQHLLPESVWLRYTQLKTNLRKYNRSHLRILPSEDPISAGQKEQRGFEGIIKKDTIEST